MRYVLAHRGVYPVKDSVTDLILKEIEQGLDKLSTFTLFRSRVEESKEKLVSLLSELKSQGKRIAGYGATSKSTTVLNYCGIGPALIDYVADTTPIKQGKFTPGMRIPIREPEALRAARPDYVLILPWNLREEIAAQCAYIREWGGRFVVPVPELEIF